MSTALAEKVLLALVLAALAVGLSQALLAYVARRDAKEAAASLPPAGAAVLAAGVVIAALVLLWGNPLTPAAGVRAAWAAALAVIFTVDLRSRYILDVFTAPLAVLALAAAVLLAQPGLLAALAGALVGLVIFAGFFLLGLILFRRPAIGLGDVKLAALLGLMVGIERILTAVFIGVLLGGLVSVLLVALRRVKMGDAPAYGTYMALGGYVALLGAAGVWH